MAKKKKYSPPRTPPARLKLISLRPIVRKSQEIKRIKQSQRDVQDRRIRRTTEVVKKGMQNLSKRDLRIKQEAIKEDRKRSVALERRLKTAKGERRKLAKEAVAKQLSEVKNFGEKAAARIAENLGRYGQKRAVNKPLLKKQRTTLVIKEIEQEPYRSVYFNQEVQQARSLYFK